MRFDIRSFAEEEDQRAALFNATLKACEGIALLRNRVLVATYIEPAKTKGGIILADKTLDESRFQGKVGLVIALGPMAFQFDDPRSSETPSIGDWVFYRASDASECGVKIVGSRRDGVLCRHIFDDQIVGRINDPELIW